MDRNAFFTWCFLTIFGSTIYGLTFVNSTNTENFKESQNNLKLKFANVVTESLLNFQGFRNMFEPFHLGVKTAAIYAKEIAKATAYSPLFNSGEVVEEVLVKYLLELFLSESANRDNINTIALTISNIIADVIIGKGYIDSTASDRVIHTYAGGLAGAIIWRLRRFQTVSAQQTDKMVEVPAESVECYNRFITSLRYRMQNSSLLHDLCRKNGIDRQNSVILSSAVCGSTYLGFNLSLIDSVMIHMMDAYAVAKDILANDMDSDVKSLVVSSVVAETLASFMMENGYLNSSPEELAYDVSKIIMTGITTSNLRLGFFKTKKTVLKNTELSTILLKNRKMFIETIADILTDSIIFNKLFYSQALNRDQIEAYSLSMAQGVGQSLSKSSDRRLRRITSTLSEAITSACDVQSVSSEEDNIENFAVAISKALVKLILKRNYINLDEDIDSILNNFRQMALNIIQALGNDFEEDSSEESSISERILEIISDESSLMEVKGLDNRISFARTLASILSDDRYFQNIFGRENNHLNITFVLEAIEEMAISVSQSPYLDYIPDTAEELAEAMATAYLTSDPGSLFDFDLEKRSYTAASAISAAVAAFLTEKGILNEYATLNEVSSLALDLSTVFISALSVEDYYRFTS